MPSTATSSQSRRENLNGDAQGHSPMMATLHAEHRHMATVLKLLDKQLDLIESDGNVDTC